MAARKEAQEDYHRGRRVHSHGLDDVLDHCHKNYGTKDMGSVQYFGDFEGKRRFLKTKHKKSDMCIVIH